MKQHITVEQLVDGINIYKWEKLVKSGFLKDRYFFDETVWEKIAEEFTIGKLMEILGERLWRIDHPLKALRNTESKKFKVWLYKFEQPSYHDKKTFIKKELVDALWEAMIYKLK